MLWPFRFQAGQATQARVNRNWLKLLQTLGVLFAAVEIRNNTKARRLANLISTTSAWKGAIADPKLKSVFKK